jgi:hypothetical protein
LGRYLTAAVAVLAGCAARNPQASRSDVTIGCSPTTPAPCEAACFAGDATGCAIFGEAVHGMADAPVRLPQDLPRGRRALDKGCAAGNLNACRTLVSYDYDDAAPGAGCPALEALCKRGDPRSCTFFGQCLDRIEHFRRDRAQALQIFQSGCDHGERTACRELAYRFMEGEGVSKDQGRAFALLDRACRMDDPLACGYEGLHLERGQGVPQDVARAKALYRKACARGIRPIPCEGLRRLGEVPPSTTVSSSDAAESRFASSRFDFAWRIPANWQFVPPSSIELGDAPAGAEVIVARPRGGSRRESLMFAVNDCDVSEWPPRGRKKRILDALEENATGWLATHGIGKSASTRGDFWGFDSVRVEGVVDGPAKRFVTLTLFCKDRRQFQLRCISDVKPVNVPCSAAFGALEIHEPIRDASEFLRVLHLRGERFGLSFDAPDDSWLGLGPREAWRHVDWIWLEGDRRIDLSVMVVDAAELPEAAFDQFLKGMEDSYRGPEATVTRKHSELGGQQCTQFSIDRRGEPSDDIFYQRRGPFIYTLTVSAPKRDADLVARVRAGLRFDVTP